MEGLGPGGPVPEPGTLHPQSRIGQATRPWKAERGPYSEKRSQRILEIT
jgi:hypothetical protein